MADWHIEPCMLARVLPLRAAYSFDRPLAPEACIQEVDGKPSFHWVAVSDGGDDIGAISLSRAPRVVCGERTNWRLRLIAVDPQWRGQGIATALLKTGADAVADLDEHAFWGSVRVPLLPWFEKIGAVVEPQEYELEPIGPHRNVLVRLADLHLDELTGSRLHDGLRPNNR